MLVYQKGILLEFIGLLMSDPKISTLLVRCASLPRVQGDKKNYRHRGEAPRLLLRLLWVLETDSKGHSFLQRNLDGVSK